MAFLSSLSASDLVKIYLNNGLDAVGAAIERELGNKDFWLEELGDKNLSLGYYTQDVMIVKTNMSLSRSMRAEC